MVRGPRSAPGFANALVARDGAQPPIAQGFTAPREGRAPPIDEPLSEAKRAQMHPRVVEDRGEQFNAGPKPTKRLYRGGECIS